MACSGFPHCRNTRPLDKPVVESIDEKCDKCGSPMELKTGKYGKFLACSKYPECKNIKPFSLGIRCPGKDCDGELIEKRTKKGKVFYGCGRYPKCTFASWDKPVASVCAKCNSPTLMESKTGDSLYCPRCKATYDRESIEA
jgi:DNA topoisomerase-1